MNCQEGTGVLSTTCSVTELTLPLELSEVSRAKEHHEGEEDVCQLLKVYLRVRPFSKAELESNENQDCLTIENQETVTLRAPKESAAMKNSEKGIGQCAHRFTFTRVFGPDSTQSEFFEGTMNAILKAYTNGVNGLVFTYGVTNAGKTFTVHGCPKDGGILPRALEMIFSHVRGRQYQKMDLKPCFSNLIKRLDDMQTKREESIKAALLASLKEEPDHSLKCTTTSGTSDSPCSNCSSPSLPLDQLDQSNELLDSERGSRYQRTLLSIWVSFFEIYNEYVYELLDSLPTSKNQKRKVLRICEDQGGSSYVKDLKWINIKNIDEAYKILKIGNKNRSLSCTKTNQQSSRSHSIFSIRLISLTDETIPHVLGVSELSLCDLAGSERCNKTQSFGDRLKEAGNINNSLLILGKCIAALKQNQNPTLRQAYIPFRESKLTRLFQPFFCGKGKACMIVNINQCASTYDETLHVMKFSAVAKQIIQTFQPKIFDYFPPQYSGREGKPAVQSDDISAEELPDDTNISSSSSEEEIDISIMTHERLEDMKESYEEKLESKFEMYKEAIKKHAYMCAMEQIEEHYVPVEEFIAEQAKVEDREMKIQQLKLKFGESNAFTLESPYSDTTEGEMNPDVKYKMMMQRASDTLSRQCEEKDELIKSLKLKMQKLNEMLQEANDVYKKTVEENYRLKQVIMFKEQETEGLQTWAKRVHELEATVSLLQKELDESKKFLNVDDFKHRKSKKGFFSNLKYTVAEVPKTNSKDSEKLNWSPTVMCKQTVHKVKESLQSF
ncbi:PREDICTED: kinesin-like protein KIF20A [Gekko japonicus]|uniref:Kinesin-like protein n=1 Tax=Gekko japonicus TaxID=146911 RepID=A0ABM1KAL7_GEKJA|nr:PREDICTED: kinesin-like protein KIF20A [Gekko japonicus]